MSGGSEHGAGPLVSLDEFFGASSSPVLPDRAAERIVGLLSRQCFAQRSGPPHPAPRGQRGGGPGCGGEPRRRPDPRGDAGEGARRGPDCRASRGRPPDAPRRGPPATAPGAGRWTHAAPALAPRRTAMPAGRSPLQGLLNKLARANYGAVLRGVRAVVTDDCVREGVLRILRKAYLEPDSTALCVGLLCDVFSELPEAGRAAAAEAVDGQVSSAVGGLRRSVVVPGADPAVDYGGFCDANLAKRSAVGRSRTLYPILRRGLITGLRGAAGGFFSAHVSLIRDLVAESRGVAEAVGPAGAEPSGGDVLAGVEVLLECCEAMLAEDPSGAPELRAAVASLGGAGGFPSSRARFKVADLLSPAPRGRRGRAA